MFISVTRHYCVKPVSRTAAQAFSFLFLFIFYGIALQWKSAFLQKKNRQSVVKSSLLSTSGWACVTMQNSTLISVLYLSPLLCKQSGAGKLEPGLDPALAVPKPARFLGDCTPSHHLANFKVVHGRGIEWVRAENLLPAKKPPKLWGEILCPAVARWTFGD